MLVREYLQRLSFVAGAQLGNSTWPPEDNELKDYCETLARHIRNHPTCAQVDRENSIEVAILRPSYRPCIAIARSRDRIHCIAAAGSRHGGFLALDAEHRRTSRDRNACR